MVKKMLTAVLLCTVFAQIMAQNSDKKLFTLEDLIPGGGTYRQSSYPENRYYAFWGEKCVELDLGEVKAIDPATGESSTLFTLEQAAKPLQQGELRHLYSAQFPYPGQPLALFKQYGRRALVDWQTGELVWSQPIDTAAESEDFSPKSRNLAFVKDHNLYVTDADGKTRAVSTDGSIDIVYGEAVHRNEFGIEKGTFWSPDGQLLAFYRMDQSMVSTYPQVSIGPFSHDQSRCAQLVPDKYPMAGETSHQVTVGIYDVKADRTHYLQLGDPTDRYFTNIAWAPDGKTLYLIELNRDQNHAQLLAFDAQSGQQTAKLLEQSDDKYVEPLHPIQFLPWDSQKFILQSRQDGFSHIYLYELAKNGRSCKLLKQLTQGEWEVFDVLGFCPSEKSIVFTSNEADQLGCAVWSVSTSGKRKAIGSTSGWHYPTLSADGTALLDNWSSPTVARQIDLASTPSAKTTPLFTASEPWDNFRVPEIKVGTIKAADGTTDLHYRLVLPTDFDATKKYPAIVYVYGGPHAHMVDATRHWGVRGWDIWMAQQGYVMFTIDNRGSEHRGKAFEQATFRRLGEEEMKDQLRGVDFLKSLPYVDADRLGVHGWSFGGFMTTSLMTTYPDVFKVGVAGGPVIDWRFYEVMYGERYMDTPQSNPDGYDSTSCLKKAANLKNRLLIIYGGNDPTCVPQHTLSFIRACIDAGTHPDLFTYPGDGHNMMGTDRVHLHEHISRYFDDFLKK